MKAHGPRSQRRPARPAGVIRKRYGAVQALADVDLDIHAGEVVALVGDNGAGKSTLVKVIAGVDPADRGTIAWEGRTVHLTRPHDAQGPGIATVYQDLALCDNLDVVGNLFLGRELRRLRPPRRGRDGAPHPRPAALLRDPHAERSAPVASLSGGQRQTIAISRSLIGEPRLVLLDEPTAALGIEQTAQVLNVVDRLRERGLGVLLISHNLGDVKAVADSVAVLRLGRNNGFFDVTTTSYEQIVSSITGATDNAVTRRTSPEWEADR